MSSSKKTAQHRALACLQALAIGDAFGESFFGPRGEILQAIAQRQVPETSWEFTDDTVMAIAIYISLISDSEILPRSLADVFHRFYHQDPNRGYGATVRRLLRSPDFIENWRSLSGAAFDGMGSMGNGAAMRAGPIGAYYYQDLPMALDMAHRSAIVTHANQEAIVGAQAVAIATALATRHGHKEEHFSAEAFIQDVLKALPNSDTRSKINKSLTVSPGYHIDTVRTILGDGTRMLAQDTVPFAIWCAAHHLEDFEAGLWKAVSMLGDRDTICAIVAGIIGMSAPKTTVPLAWQESVEAINPWLTSG